MALWFLALAAALTASAHSPSEPGTLGATFLGGGQPFDCKGRRNSMGISNKAPTLHVAKDGEFDAFVVLHRCTGGHILKADYCKDDPPPSPPGPPWPKDHVPWKDCMEEWMSGACDSDLERLVAGPKPGKVGHYHKSYNKNPKARHELVHNNKGRSLVAGHLNGLDCAAAWTFHSAFHLTRTLERAGLVEPVEFNGDFQTIQEKGLFAGDFKPVNLEKFEVDRIKAKELKNLLEDGKKKGTVKLGPVVLKLFEKSFDIPDIVAYMSGGDAKAPERSSQDLKGVELTLEEYKKAVDLRMEAARGCYSKKEGLPGKGIGVKDLDDDLAKGVAQVCEPFLVVGSLIEMLAKQGKTVAEATENMEEGADARAAGPGATQLTGKEDRSVNKAGRSVTENGLSGVGMGKTFDGSIERGGDIDNPGGPADRASGIISNDNARPNMLREQGPAPLGTMRSEPTGGSGIMMKGTEQSGGFVNWASSWFGENSAEQLETEEATAAAIRSANRKP